MGCCFSRSPSDSGEAIRISPIHGNQTPLEQEQQQPRVEHALPLQDRFNRPLHRHVWVSKIPLTAGQLRLRREEYFDTRVTGRMEIWNAIRMAVDVLDEDLETAQQILNAAGVSIPTGNDPSLFLWQTFIFFPSSHFLPDGGVTGTVGYF